MKRTFKKLGVLITMLIVSNVASAYDFEADGIYYSIVDKDLKNIAVTYKDRSYNSYHGAVKIPETVNYNGINYSVTAIAEYAFKDCSVLDAVSVSNSVKTIDAYAFVGCKNLKTLVIGAGVIEIGKYNKSYEITIPKVIWLCNTRPKGYSNIKAEMNYVSTKLGLERYEVIYPFLSSSFEVDNVVYVPVSPSDRTCDVIDCNYAPSSGEIRIDSLVSNRGIQLKVNDVRPYSFYKNNSVTSLEISNNGNIGKRAFYENYSVTSLKINNKGYIGDYAFSSCDLSEGLTLGDNITWIGACVFENSRGLKHVIIPDNVSSIGGSAFSNCKQLTDVKIGKGMDFLSSYIFSDCIALRQISIPDNIWSIKNNAFSGCTALRDLTFEEFELNGRDPQIFPDWTSTNYSANSESSQEYNIEVKKGDCLSFESNKSGVGYLELYIDGEGEFLGNGYHSIRFSKAGTIKLSFKFHIYSNPDGSETATISNIGLNQSTLHLDDNGNRPLFSDCPLDEVFIGRKLLYSKDADSGFSPFYRNTSLRVVTITDEETEIYENEFYGCSNLQSFTCGDGVTRIGNRAFSGCAAMKSYSSGTQVKEIGEEAFSDCTGLTSFTTLADIPPICSNQALDDINKWECMLKVPTESVDDYKAAAQWKEFFFIEENSGINDITADSDLRIISLQDGIVLEGCDGSAVSVYGIDGRMIWIADEYDGSEIRLPKGIFIILAGSRTKKIRI